ncbi:Lar family restriction alleviation protein [Mesorhizobium sp.]|uniref:Lar family restriction alleviation protein n=1 Tax=Mesorhizobium sp. TaxID=1871066 RepID=UPI00257FDA77|nr:Lar family restriction alleviation protein [Mesorhizobium sp.]
MDVYPDTEESEKVELLRCPFCGGKAAITDQEPFCVECVEERCNVDGPCHADKADAIAAWNRRAMQLVPVDASEAMIQEALKVDWSNEDEVGTVQNVWHAMLAAALISGGRS